MSEADLRPPTPAGGTDRDQLIRAVAERWLAGPNQDLYEQMLVTICRLARDGADRGDVKLLHKSLAELRYGMKVFRPYAATRKVSIFGSSRTPEGHPDYVAAETFARTMCDRGWMVITGAGNGIMKAGHGGAGPEASFGVAIRLPFEQETNEIIAADPKLVNFRYFFTRKLIFIKEASAVALFPGGFGTQDEGFEALTLVQTGKSQPIPIVLCEQPGGTYWPHWRTYVAAELLRTGMISPEDMHLFHITDSVEQAAQAITDFYRVFHSSRYVNDDLVIRLQRPISPETLERLNDEYAPHLLDSGCITACAPLPEENGDHAELPRLRLRFNKRSFGLLRRMVDTLSADPDPAAAAGAGG